MHVSFAQWATAGRRADLKRKVLLSSLPYAHFHVRQSNEPEPRRWRGLLCSRLDENPRSSSRVLLLCRGRKDGAPHNYHRKKKKKKKTLRRSDPAGNGQGQGPWMDDMMEGGKGRHDMEAITCLCRLDRRVGKQRKEKKKLRIRMTKIREAR